MRAALGWAEFAWKVYSCRATAVCHSAKVTERCFVGLVINEVAFRGEAVMQARGASAMPEAAHLPYPLREMSAANIAPKGFHQIDAASPCDSGHH